jgi:uncharacterized Zn finger protein
MSWGWYPSSNERKRDNANARKKASKLKGTSPVNIEGRAISTTFWGKAWCSNLETYSDYESRLARGRTYVRGGNVVDLKIKEGEIDAKVVGSGLYTVQIDIKDMSKAKWATLVKNCHGSIASMVELLEGNFSSSIMNAVICTKTGLFPSQQEISFECSCPDWASMCKHVAAVLYGVGNRLDSSPELLFLLRGTDHTELLSNQNLAIATPKSKRVLTSINLYKVFEIEEVVPVVEKKTTKKILTKKTTSKKTIKKKVSKVKKARA